MKLTIIILLSVFSVMQRVCAQQLLLDQKGISKSKIQQISLQNLNLFGSQEDDEPSDNEGLNTVLTFDKDGRLLSVMFSHVESRDTVYLRNDLFVYVEGQLFMWVNRHKYCDEASRAEHDGKCMIGYGFTLLERDSTGVVLKNYGADDETGGYLEFFFNGSQKETGMYLRGMEWRKRIRDIHHVDSKTKEDILEELFIYYSYTTDEANVTYDEETGDSTVSYVRGGYAFSKTDYATSSSFADFIPLDNLKIRKSDVALIGFDRKAIDKLKKYKAIRLSLFQDEAADITFKSENQSGKSAGQN